MHMPTGESRTHQPCGPGALASSLPVASSASARRACPPLQHWCRGVESSPMSLLARQGLAPAASSSCTASKSCSKAEGQNVAGLWGLRIAAGAPMHADLQLPLQGSQP